MDEVYVGLDQNKHGVRIETEELDICNKPEPRRDGKIPGCHKPFRKIRYPGRNQPCPCNSGKKWKKCCLLTLK